MAKKQFTVSHFKEIVKPSLSQREIYIREDVVKIDDLEDIDTAKKVAQLLPLIRVNDYVIHRTDLEYFSIDVGGTLLPRISFTFNDEYFKFRKLITSKLDFITVYFGNVGDEYFVKQEYVLSDVFANPDNPNVTLSGFLYVPDFYKQHVRYFNDETNTETSWKLIKKLCEECKLGFFTNVDETNDAQIWIQDNCTTYEFIQRVMKHSYISNDTKIIFFIDQYDYLNMIDLTKAYSNKELEKTAKHPMEGKPLDKTHDVILTSGRYDKDNYPFMIANWTANLQFGSNIERLPKRIDRNEYSLSELPFKVVTGALETNTDIIEQNWYLEPTVTDVHKNYRNIVSESVWVNTHFNQGDEISCIMSWPVMLLYPYMYLPLKLYFETKKVEIDDQNAPKNAEQLDAEKPEFSGEVETLDELHSGDYLVTSIKYEMFADGSDTNRQTVTLKRLPLENPPKIKVT